MDETRRKLLKAALLGAGGVGLRGLAASLPAALLGAPRRAAAAPEPCNATAFTGNASPQRLILITSAGGDPMNANVPGCYDHAKIYHPPGLATATLTFDRDYVCGKPWADLVAAAGIGNRICFFHHATYSNAHGDHAKVNALMGAIRRQELLVSLVSRFTAGCAVRTVQTAPAVLSDVLIRCAGAVQPVLSRDGLANVLGVSLGDASTLDGRLRIRRDADLVRLNDVLRRGATPAQARALDGYDRAQAEARSQIDPDLVTSLGTNVPGETNQARLNTAAVTLLKMNVTPAVVMSYDFGGDNHSDYNLGNEQRTLEASCADLADLYRKLTLRGLQDDVTIVLMNVFGRTLNADRRNGNEDGRDHNAAHHCTVIIGKGFNGCVIGGVTPIGNEFRAEDIESATGRPVPLADVRYEATLACLGKTIAAGVGLGKRIVQDPIDGQITSGTVMRPALSAPALAAWDAST